MRKIYLHKRFDSFFLQLLDKFKVYIHYSLSESKERPSIYFPNFLELKFYKKSGNHF